MFDYGFEQCGQLFQYNVFWEMAYATKDPNVVKVCLFLHLDKCTARTGCNLGRSRNRVR